MRIEHKMGWIIVMSFITVMVGITIVQAQSASEKAPTEAMDFDFESKLIPQNPEKANINVKAKNLDPMLMLDIANATNDKTISERGKVIAGRLNAYGEENSIRSGRKFANQLDKWQVGGEWVVGVKGRDGYFVTVDRIMSFKNWGVSPQRGAATLLARIRLNLRNVHRDGEINTMAPRDRNIDDRRDLAQTRVGQGDTYYADHKMDAAIEMYKSSITFFPEGLMAYTGLEQSYRERNLPGDKKNADLVAVLIQQLTAALTEKTKGDDAWDLVEAVDPEGKTPEGRAGYGKARVHYTKAKELFPKCDTFYLYESMAYQLAGDKEHAISVLKDTPNDSMIIDDVPSMPGHDAFETRLRYLTAERPS